MYVGTHIHIHIYTYIWLRLQLHQAHDTIMLIIVQPPAGLFSLAILDQFGLLAPATNITPTWTPQVCKIMAQSLNKMPKRT